MPLFLDACAFAKRYMEEGDSTQRIREITGRFEDWSAREASPRTIGVRALRRHRDAVAAFRADLSTEAVTVVSATGGLVTRAANLLDLRPGYNISAG